MMCVHVITDQSIKVVPDQLQDIRSFQLFSTMNFRLVVQKCNIEFQIDQSDSAKLSGLLNVIGQFTFQYCVFGQPT